jgi:hypothetical protein
VVTLGSRILTVFVDVFPESCKKFGDATTPLLRHSQAMLVSAMAAQLGKYFCYWFWFVLVCVFALFPALAVDCCCLLVQAMVAQLGG